MPILLRRLRTASYVVAISCPPIQKGRFVSGKERQRSRHLFYFRKHGDAPLLEEPNATTQVCPANLDRPDLGTEKGKGLTEAGTQRGPFWHRHRRKPAGDKRVEKERKSTLPPLPSQLREYLEMGSSTYDLAVRPKAD